MNKLSILIIPAAALLSACTIGPTHSTDITTAHTAAEATAGQLSHETILLVSLDNGTVVMQKIESAADVCFKVNSDSTTTCLTQGAALFDPDTNSVIGYQMIEEKIELIAKTD